jgi:hypothetical protein
VGVIVFPKSMINLLDEGADRIRQTLQVPSPVEEGH